MNENTISTFLGGVVIVLIAGLIFNYFRTTNLKTWQGMLLDQQQTASTEQKPIVVDSVNTMDTYKVVKGDDLWHISEKFYKSGYNYVDIMKENKIGRDGKIYQGMELRIPRVEAKKLTVIEPKIAETKNTPVESGVKVNTSANTIEVGEYTTIKGDSLWSISVRAYADGYQWTKIYWANKKVLNNPDVIYSGVKLVIPKLSK